MVDVTAPEAQIATSPPPTIEPAARTEVWEVQSAEATRSPLETDPTPRSSEDRIIRHGAWSGVVDGAGGSLAGGKAADAIKSAVDVIAKGGTYAVKDSTGADITVDIPSGGMVFQGKDRISSEAEIMGMSVNLNRMVRETKGGAACFAFGQIYEDNEGKLTLTYASLGDSEIAVVKRDGSVVLVPNKSVRELAEKKNDIDLYLSEREATWMYAEGQATQQLRQNVNTGSIDLDEGDRVVYLTDGIAEDLHNIRGTILTDGTITPQKGVDGRMIGLDILGTIDPATPIEQMPTEILKKLDHFRTSSVNDGVEIKRNRTQYNDEVTRRIINAGTVDKPKYVVVGGKGPTTDRGYDDGETVVVAEAKKKPVAQPEVTVTPETADEEEEEDPIKKARIDYLKNHTLSELSPYAIETMIAGLGGGSVYGILRSRLLNEATLYESCEQGSAEAEGHLKNIQALQALAPMAESSAAAVQKRLDQLRRSTNPEARALGLDIGIALNVQEIKHLEEIVSHLERKLPTVAEDKRDAAALQIGQYKRDIRDLQVEQERSRIDRAEVKISGIVLPNQAAAAAMEVVKVFEGKASFSDEEIEQFDENPLESLTKHFTAMIGNPEVAQTNIAKLITRGLISQENGRELMASFVEMNKSMPNEKKFSDYVIPTLGLLIGLFYLLIQKAGAAEMGGGGGR